MEQLSKNLLEKLKQDIEDTVKDLNIADKRSRLGELETESMGSTFWNNQESARKIMSEIENLREEIKTAEELESQIDTLLQIYEIAEESEHAAMLDEVKTLEERFLQFQTFKFLAGKYDQNDVILSIHSGQGGTEANDWTEMILRMYKRYVEKKGWSFEVLHMVPGSEAGLSTATMVIHGRYAYGSLKREAGTHRLVRLSPFNSQNLRQTSFAGVEVMPLIEESDNTIEIKESDLEFKAVKAGGAGGQHVNKTSSAVQITHLPSGITVHNSEHRSQAQNRKAALNILKAKLWLIEEEKREAELAKLKGEHKIAGWGNQIRNYVLHPYKLVKDLRTSVESNNPESVLDGEIQNFIDAEIRIS